MDAVNFVRRWRERAIDSDDCFDAFFSAWIALVIAARGHLDQNQRAQPDTDRIAILQYFEDHATSVVKVLSGLPNEISWLANRTGTGTGAAILDVYSYSPQHLRDVFDTLADVWSGNPTRKPRWVSRATAEMINHIRNNLFHGVKRVPDDAADRELLERVNKILIAVLNTWPAA